jgi:hypothetical protein
MGSPFSIVPSSVDERTGALQDAPTKGDVCVVSSIYAESKDVKTKTMLIAYLKEIAMR